MIVFKEVVALIKRDPIATQLLVASEEIDRWYLSNNQQYSYDSVIIFETNNANHHNLTTTKSEKSNSNLNNSYNVNRHNTHTTQQMKNSTNGNGLQRENLVIFLKFLLSCCIILSCFFYY